MLLLRMLLLLPLLLRNAAVADAAFVAVPSHAVASCDWSSSSSSNTRPPRMQLRVEEDDAPLIAIQDDRATSSKSLPTLSSSRRIPSQPGSLPSDGDETFRLAALTRQLATLVLLLGSFWGSIFLPLPLPPTAWAAPPIAVIAEELGYFPVQSSRDGTVTYVPRRVRRDSTDQAVRLAEYLHNDDQKNIALLGTYWCPHTSRQKELLGRQAFGLIHYVECAPRGFQANPKLCAAYGVTGYPTWVVLDDNDNDEGQDDGSSNNKDKPTTRSRQLAGERSLAEVAEFAGYPGRFSDRLEQRANPPPPLGGAAKCQQQ